MNVAWCVMALALTGNTDEPTTSESAVCGAHPANTECQEIWPMSLSAATCIALDNNNLLRVVTEGAPSVPGGGFEPARVDPAGSHADNSPIVVTRINTSESPKRPWVSTSRLDRGDAALPAQGPAALARG